MAVEKGTKAVILANFRVFGERKFNNLQANFEIETLRKEFFNSHSPLHSLSELRNINPTTNIDPQTASPFLEATHPANNRDTFAIRAMLNDRCAITWPSGLRINPTFQVTALARKKVSASHVLHCSPASCGIMKFWGVENSRAGSGRGGINECKSPDFDIYLLD